MKYYCCIMVPEDEAKEDINMFIQYTFGSDRCAYQWRNKWGDYSYGDYYEMPTKRYDFTKNKIYSSIDDGIHITDDSRVVYNFSEVSHCFIEVSFELDDTAKALIAKKEAKGDSIRIDPFMIDEQTHKMSFFVTCSVAKGRRYICVTRESSDIYEAIIQCYRSLRDSCPEIPHKIKDILEDRMRKTRR